MIQYYRQWLYAAFRHSIGPSDVISFLLGIFSPPLACVFPGVEVVMRNLAWQMPLAVLIAVLFIRLLLAPYWVHQEGIVRTEELAKQLDSLQATLGEQQRRRKIRETLAIFWQEGQEILAKTRDESKEPPNAEADVWAGRVEQFLENTLGIDYVATFRSHDGLPIGITTLYSIPHQRLEGGIETRLARLQQFLEELRTS